MKIRLFVSGNSIKSGKNIIKKPFEFEKKKKKWKKSEKLKIKKRKRKKQSCVHTLKNEQFEVNVRLHMLG